MAKDEKAETAQPLTLDMFMAGLELVLAKHGEARTQQMDQGTLADAISGGMAEAMKRQERSINPNNPSSPAVSAFNPFGDRDHPKPPFKWQDQTIEVFHANSRVRHDQCTPLEVQVVNALAATIGTPDAKRESRGGKWSARLNKNGTQMMIDTPWQSTEDKMEVNASTFVQICMELAQGREATDPNNVLARLAAAEARLAALGEPQALAVPA